MLTLLHDRLFFNVLSDKFISRQEDDYKGRAREYRDLFINPKHESPKNWTKLKSVWKSVPHEFNTLENPMAFRTVEYAGGSAIPGMSELDFYFSKALQSTNFRESGHYAMSKYQFISGIHASWVWFRSGIGYATEDPILADALGILIQLNRDFNFDDSDRIIFDWLEEFHEWNPLSDETIDESAIAPNTSAFDLIIPDLSELSWDAIIHLRNHNMHKHFRDWYSTQVSILRRNPHHILSKETIQDKLWQLALEVEPNVKSDLIKGFVGNIPTGPLPNPFDLIFDLLDIKGTLSMTKTFGWLIWLSYAQKTSSSGQIPDK